MILSPTALATRRRRGDGRSRHPRHCRRARRCCGSATRWPGSRRSAGLAARAQPARASSPSPAASARPAPRRRCAWRSAPAARVRLGRQPQQSLGRAAVARPPAARRRLRRVRARHEPSRRDRRADPAGAAACRGDHDGRAGASRLFPVGRGDRRRQGRDLSTGSSPAALAVLNRDNPHFARLAAAAQARGAAAIIGFGAHPEAAVRLVDCVSRAARQHGDGRGRWARSLAYRLPVPGRHWVMNALAVLGAAVAAGGDPAPRRRGAGARSKRCRGAAGAIELPWRGGALTLIDESYNASPAAMRAALAVLGATTPAPGGRRVAVLGDMLELGDAAAAPASRAGRAAHRRRSRPRLPGRRRRWPRCTRLAGAAPGRLVAIGRSGRPCARRFLGPATS